VDSDICKKYQTLDGFAVLCGMPTYSIRLEELGYLRTSCLLPAFD